MNDGYYVSCYATVDKLCNLYQLPLADRHDQCVALWSKAGNTVDLIRYWELERFTGVKHHNFAWYDGAQLRGVIARLLQEVGVSIFDVNEFWGTSALMSDPASIAENGYTYHSLCHLYSAIMLESKLFFEETILGLSLDYGSDYETESRSGQHEFVGCVVERGKLKYFPIQSPAALWATAAEASGMEEGSLMALATATACSLPGENRLMPLEMYHVYSNSVWNVWSVLTEDVAGMSEDNFRKFCIGYDDGFTLRENKLSAVMKQIQEYSTRLIAWQVDRILAELELKAENVYLAVGGGFCLNCPTNTYLMNTFRFKGFLAPPCVNDGGQALGIGLYEFSRQIGKFEFSFGQHAFYGATGDTNAQFWKKVSSSHFVHAVETFSAETACMDLAEDIVVWYEGNAEIGPRALGHRCLLGNATSPLTKKRINDVKKRQRWRPVAPIVMEERVSDFFWDSYPSPFMLHTFSLRKDMAQKLPSIAHLDGTARIQTVGATSKENRRIYRILEELENYNGLPVVCCTSLNDRGEPVIQNPLRAMEFAVQNRICHAYIEGRRITLGNFEDYDGSFSTTPYVETRIEGSDCKAAEENPFCVPTAYLTALAQKGRKGYELKNHNFLPELTAEAERIITEKKRRQDLGI